MSTQPISTASVASPHLYLHRSSSSQQPIRRIHVNATTRFGRRLRMLRRERNLTQTRMATVFGIDRSFISDLELGKKSVSLPMLEVFALGFGMSLSDLLRDI